MCLVCGEAISEQDKEEIGTSLNRPFELFLLWHCHSLMPATAWTPAPCRWHVWMYHFCMGMRSIEDVSVGSDVFVLKRSVW